MTKSDFDNSKKAWNPKPKSQNQSSANYHTNYYIPLKHMKSTLSELQFQLVSPLIKINFSKTYLSKRHRSLKAIPLWCQAISKKICMNSRIIIQNVLYRNIFSLLSLNHDLHWRIWIFDPWEQDQSSQEKVSKDVKSRFNGKKY